MLLIFIVKSVILIVLFFKKDDIMTIEITGRIEKKGFAQFQFEATQQKNNDLVHIKNTKKPFFSLFSCCMPAKRNKLEQCFASPGVFRQIKDPQNKTYRMIVSELDHLANQTLANNLERQKVLATLLGDYMSHKAAYLDEPMRQEFKASCNEIIRSLLQLSSHDYNDLKVTQKQRTERQQYFGYKLDEVENKLSDLTDQFKHLLRKTDAERQASVEQAKNRKPIAPAPLVFPSAKPVESQPVSPVVDSVPAPLPPTAPSEDVIEVEPQPSEIPQPSPIDITEAEPKIPEEVPEPAPTVSDAPSDEVTLPTVVLCPIDELVPIQPLVLDPAIEPRSLENLYKTCLTSLSLLAGSLPASKEKKSIEDMLPGWIYPGTNPTIGMILEVMDCYALENTFAQKGAVEIRQAFARTEATWKALNTACDPDHPVAFSENHPYHAFPLYSLRELIHRHTTHNPETLTEAIDGMRLLDLKQVKGAWKGQVQSIISQLQEQPEIRQKVENYFALIAKTEQQIALWSKQEPYQFDRARSVPVLLDEAQDVWEHIRSESFMQVEELINIYTLKLEKQIYAEPRPLTQQLAALEPSVPEYGQLRRLVVEEKAQQLKLVLEQLSSLKIDKKSFSGWDKTLEELKKCKDVAENPEFLEQIDSPQQFLRQSEKHLDTIFKMVASHFKNKIVARWQPYQATIKFLENNPTKGQFDSWKQSIETVLTQGKAQGRYERIADEMNKISKASAPKRVLNERLIPNLDVAKIVSDSLFSSRNQPWHSSLQEVFEECLTELCGQISDCKSLAQHREWFAKFNALKTLILTIGLSAHNSAQLLSELIPNYAEALLAINPVAGKREEYQALKTHLQNQTKGVWPFNSSSIETMADVQALDLNLESIKTLKVYGYWFQKVLNVLIASLPETLHALAKECYKYSLDYKHLIYDEAKIRTMTVSELSALATTIDQTNKTLVDVREVLELEKEYSEALIKAQYRVATWPREIAIPYIKRINEIKSEYESMKVTGWLLSFVKSDTYSRMGDFYRKAIDELVR